MAEYSTPSWPTKDKTIGSELVFSTIQIVKSKRGFNGHHVFHLKWANHRFGVGNPIKFIVRAKSIVRMGSAHPIFHGIVLRSVANLVSVEVEVGIVRGFGWQIVNFAQG